MLSALRDLKVESSIKSLSREFDDPKKFLEVLWTPKTNFHAPMNTLEASTQNSQKFAENVKKHIFQQKKYLIL